MSYYIMLKYKSYMLYYIMRMLYCIMLKSKTYMLILYHAQVKKLTSWSTRYESWYVFTDSYMLLCSSMT